MRSLNSQEDHSLDYQLKLSSWDHTKMLFIQPAYTQHALKTGEILEQNGGLTHLPQVRNHSSGLVQGTYILGRAMRSHVQV